MGIRSLVERHYHEAKGNKWFHFFAIFCRIVLALGFIPSAFVKIVGERFTALPANHPLGQYFESLQLTGFYYTFIGIVQVIAAILLLIPRTALLGAIVYFPVILNICVLAYAVRFEGTRITTLMLLANLFLLFWDYEKLKHILPFKRAGEGNYVPRMTEVNNKFPFVFFGCVVAAAGSVIVINHFVYDIRPGNSAMECTNGCPDNSYPDACADFCDCIYSQGRSLAGCLEDYERAKEMEANR
jgi:uncharacterized membrane protein YphA (DoxX/SURF4 family)